MKNKFGIELETINPGRRVLLALDKTMFREEAAVEGVMKSNSGNFISIYVRRSDGTRARTGFDQIAELVRTRKAKAA